MARKKYIAYVKPAVMENAVDLFDAAYAHLINKDCLQKKRRRFMHDFMRCYDDKGRFKVIYAMVEVRDVATFPFRNKPKSGEADIIAPDYTPDDEETDEG